MISSHYARRGVHHVHVASGMVGRQNNSVFCVSTIGGDPHLGLAWNVLYVLCTVTVVKISLLLLFVLEIECLELEHIWPLRDQLFLDLRKARLLPIDNSAGLLRHQGSGVTQ